jgi:hypothetical protein
LIFNFLLQIFNDHRGFLIEMCLYI